jgi:phage terminase large subunit
MANDVKVEVTNVFERNDRAEAKTVINQGGAGSSKTYSLCQFFIFNRLLQRRDYKLLILRKTRHANKLSVYEDFIGLLRQYGIYQESNHNKSDLIYRVPEQNSYVRFAGLDDYQQIKSTQWHDIWIEEANEITKREYLFLLTTRLYRGWKKATEVSRIWLSFNPEYCWIKDIENSDNVEVILSNYNDNPFCNQEYIDSLEELEKQDIALWQIYSKGQWAELTNIIYKPYRMANSWDDNFHEVIYGLDFGFNVQTALLKIGERDNELWLDERIYQTKLTNQDLIQRLQLEIPQQIRYRPIYADCAEPARIQEISNAGFNIFPADKSVKDGIDFCRRKVFYTKKENVNLNRERAGYKYKEDKDGNVIDDPVKFRDNLMDAKRYAVYTHWGLAQEIYEAPYEEERGMAYEAYEER